MHEAVFRGLVDQRLILRLFARSDYVASVAEAFGTTGRDSIHPDIVQ
jgi:hypothetical protein